jgi:hypothetical protein
MKGFLQSKIVAVVDMPDPMFYFLFDTCKNHYDYTIKSFTEVGGFLYGNRNRRMFSKTNDTEIELNSRQCDSLLKALEMGSDEMSLSLFKIIYKVFLLIRSKRDSINEQLQKEEFDY